MADQEAEILQRSLGRCGKEYAPEDVRSGLRRSRARRWFRGLSWRSRLIIHLSYGEGLTDQEIAAVLDLDLLEVRKRLAHLIVHLRRVLGAPARDEEAPE